MNINNQQDQWDAKHYKKNSDGQFDHGVSTIREINFRGNENVLDVGCGDGRITAEIAKHVPEGTVIGLDISPNMITEAKSSFNNIKNLEFVCSDAITFSIDKKFDLITSFAAFHWVKDQESAVKNLYKHLKPGGKIIIQMGAFLRGPVSEVYEFEKWAPFLSKRPQSYFPQTVSGFGKLLENAGFQDINVKQELFAGTCQNKEDLFNAIFAWVPHSTGLPDDKAREFTQDIVDRICAARNDGKIVFETALLNAKAVKF
ncbi:MAG: methyltransferase domain-containing protein [Candidatus Babeliales bacterium]|nr:MAG: hypothetical protein US22_C0013G0002 [candidate division TM6 bacterium GW2011_GWF2_36_6]